MKITADMLQDWKACEPGYTWFLEHFPSGEAEYQAVLDTLAADDKPNYANWLMDRAGGDQNAVLEVDAILDCKHLFFAGHITIKKGLVASGQVRAGRGIEAGDGIKAGRGIEAGDGIKAGRGIEAGWGIEAGSGIEAGDDYGVFAGLRIKISNWMIFAKVTAKSKPKNLISGCWVEPEANDE